MKTIDWTLQPIWNDTLIEQGREVEARDYIRASEVGGAFIDRYLKMTGVQFSDPFDARTYRLFEAGNIYEWLVRLVLIRSGLLVAHQTEVKITGDKHLDVIGHLDFIGGGKPDFREAEKIMPLLEALYFPTKMMTVADKIIEELQAKFPDGLPKLLYEVKTVNSMVFWRHNKAMERPYPHHELQLYTYLKGMKMNEGRFLYISKDDLTLSGVALVVDDELEARWQADVQQMTKYYNTKTMPELESPIVWDEESSKYSKNWKVERSNYFTLIHKDKDKDEFIKDIKNLANRANARVKKAHDLKEDITDAQVQEVVDPYIKGELSDKLHIIKEVQIA